MVDTFSAPAADKCVLEGCGRPRSEHHPTFGHNFVAASQVRLRQPVDPLRNVRKMTDEEKQGATAATRALSGSSPAALRNESRRTSSPSTTAPDDACTVPGCGKPKRHHRGSIGHRFNGAEPIMRKKREFRSERGWVPKVPDVRDMAVSEEDEAMPFDYTGQADVGRPRETSVVPIVLTEALIMQSVIRALRAIDCAPHVRTRDVRFNKLDYSIGDDAKLLSVDVTAKVSLIFPTGDAE